MLSLGFFLAVANFGAVDADFKSDYDYDVELTANQEIPLEVKRKKIEKLNLALDTKSDIPVKAVRKIKKNIKIKPGESKIQRNARLVSEEAERQRIARENALAKQRTKVAVLPVTGQNTGDAWYRLRMCEAGNVYNRNSGNGYYGAYQFAWSTWRGYAPAGYADVRPDLAPPAVQDQAAKNLYNRRGWQPWPACSRKLGLR